MSTENEIIQQMDELDNAFIQTVLTLNQRCGSVISTQLWLSLLTMRSEIEDRLWMNVGEKITDQLCSQGALRK